MRERIDKCLLLKRHENQPVHRAEGVVPNTPIRSNCHLCSCTLKPKYSLLFIKGMAIF